MIASILGNRPHFIKHALLSKRLRQEHDEVIIHTGQHYDDAMSTQFFREMEIPEPDAVLGVGGLSSLLQIGKMLDMLEVALSKSGASPDLVLVHGDTNSSLAGALAASKLHIPVAHVEAGVRCGDRGVPEEINRILIDHMSDLLFCPTRVSYEALMYEGAINHVGVYFTGDVLYDTYLHYSQIAEPSECDVFVTIHREANTDSRGNLTAIVNAISRLDVLDCKEIVFPTHPRTAKSIGKWGMFDALFEQININQVVPVGYLQTLSYIKGARLVITDSGGVQREAYFARVPCIYIGTAGWQELIQAGASVQVEANTEQILEAAKQLESKPYYVTSDNILGDGNAVEKIAEVIRKWEQR